VNLQAFCGTWNTSGRNHTHPHNNQKEKELSAHASKLTKKVVEGYEQEESTVNICLNNLEQKT